MSDPVRFLNAVAQSLGVMTLYAEGHPSRERAVDVAFEELDALMRAPTLPSFTFLDDEVVFGRERVRDLKSWDWGRKLVAVGIERVEFERRVSRDEFAGFLQEVHLRLTPASDVTEDARQMRSLGVRFGPVGTHDQEVLEPPSSPPIGGGLELTLGEEAETFRWLQSHVQSGRSVPLLEAEAVVRSLSVAMHGDSRMLLPLLKLKEFDQYTTTHSLNVAVLSMGLAESLGCRPKEIRSIGVAGLLHDIGKIRIPLEILTKPGKLTDEERTIMNSHPIDGARVIMQSEEDLGIAATVAYEHHVMLNGGGYPAFHYTRECTMASRLVHICDVYDALSTNRPYRDAWPTEKTMGYLEERAGSEFDPVLVSAFLRTLRQGQAQIRVLDEGHGEAVSG